MNKTAILSFILGVGAGSAAGYYICKTKLEKAHIEQINSAREHYKAKYEAKLNEGLKAVGIDILERNESTGKEPEVKEKMDRIANVGAAVKEENETVLQKTDYSKYSKEPVGDVVVTDGPYIADEEEYEDVLGVDRYEITYFEDDDVFMDSKETVWPDGLSKIGDENLLKILNDGEDEAFIINNDFGEAYHLTIDDGSYEEYMMG